MEKKLLMIPGPIEIAPDVLNEMNVPMEPHYGVKWTNFYYDTIERVKKIIGTESDTFLHVGSGHAAIDAVIGSIVEEGEKVLVLSNGFFGERIAEIVESFRGTAVQFKTDWGKALSPSDIDDYLNDNHEKFSKVMVVHHDTSTGVRNPVKEIARVVKKYGLLLFVDAVCSIGVTEFKMDEWGIDACITASQKGLGAPPGLAIISVNDKAWEVIENRKQKPTGWYLNLATMREFAEKQKEWQPYGITMAVNNVKALNKALRNIEEEGLESRIERHDNIGRYFRNGIRALGLETGASEEDAANNVTVIFNPEGMGSQELIDILEQEYQIMIANGLGVYAGKAFRVGHMNLGASKNSVVPVINALDEIIDKKL